MKLTQQFEKQLTARLAELQPAVDEYREIERLLAVIQKETAPSAPSTAKKPAARRRPANRRSGATKPRRGKSRADEALRLVSEQPGITVADLSKKMGIGTTYLYRVLPALEKDGRVRKVGKGYEPAA